MTSSPRTVVTGLGAMAPNGSGTEEFWKATLDGRSGITPLHRYDAARYPARLAGQILDFTAEDHIPGRLLPQTDRITRLALHAAQRALDDSGADPGSLPDYDMGVVTSSAAGGFEFTHREVRKLWTKGPQYVSVYESFAWFYAVNTGQISIRHGMRGPSGVLVGEQAGGLDAIGHARRTVRRGAPLVVTGGMDSSLDPWGWLSHLGSGRVSASDDPDRAYRPFDRDADGHVPGEGGAILIVEDEGAARARGAGACYGEIAGYAATFDPPPGSPRPPGLGQAARLALDDAGVRSRDVDVVFADAAGLPALDRAEATALREIFGPESVPVTAPKSLTGRLSSGGPPLDVVAALLSIRDSVIPPTEHTREVPPDYGLDLVLDAPRRADVRTALVLARGFGGFNAAVVIRTATPDR
ncbi:ketosynthase chain-length factor [Streptomyces boncukensis]|uniref:Ketosynthase chain-length factor n=1 Tax=Streptomyces boncukensis TaxID=2711219 RepID=A0A6G4X0U9_9ACTN|nr:ketosynthase chain-length factor [Streptomyces boncukensis]NGO70291.1 ketosynthase chain-length factor [Streptomyces boncukensis]